MTCLLFHISRNRIHRQLSCNAKTRELLYIANGVFFEWKMISLLQKIVLNENSNTFNVMLCFLDSTKRYKLQNVSDLHVEHFLPSSLLSHFFHSVQGRIQDSPLEGQPTLQEGAPTYDFAKNFQKNCMKLRNFWALGVPLPQPMQGQGQPMAHNSIQFFGKNPRVGATSNGES